MWSAILLLLLGIVVILIIIAANGYFVAQEFAYMAVDRSRLSAQADEGDQSAEQALKVTRRTAFMLSGAQLGITVTGLLVGYVAEPMVGESLGVLLGGVGIPPAVSISVGTVLALAISTIVQMIFGELYPKNLAIAAPGPLARRLARSTNIYLAVFGWLVKVFDVSANGLLRVLRIQPVQDLDSSATAGDLKHIVADSRQTGDLDDQLSMMIDRILDFPQRDVEHAMKPRSQTNTVESDTTLEQVRTLMSTEHSRYPVLDGGEEPVGVVHLVDVLAAAATPDEPVTSIMRKPLILPTVMTLPQAREQLLDSQTELACVIDEYGGLTGILTLEDLAEEITGDVTDEHDDAGAALAIEVHSTDSWRMAGDLPVDEAEREIDHDLPRGDYETIAGMLIAYLKDLPRVGQTVRMDMPQTPSDLMQDEHATRYVDVTVLEVDKHVPTLVELAVQVTSDEPDQEGTPS
ncbi:MAG: hemolysin family protein [Yaniella sp.]|nr:hemolysin family protein [Yaniella sp.]